MSRIIRECIVFVEFRICIKPSFDCHEYLHFAYIHADREGFVRRLN